MWGRQERHVIRQTNPVGMLINPGNRSALIWYTLKKNDASNSRRGRFMRNKQRGPDGPCGFRERDSSWGGKGAIAHGSLHLLFVAPADETCWHARCS